MFSNQRKQLNKKPGTSTPTRTTTTTTTTSTTSTNKNASTSNSNSNSTPPSRPIVKISTIKRTVEVKKVYVAPPIPNARILASQLASVKRKAEEEELDRINKLKKSGNVAKERREKAALLRAEEGGSESSSEEESESEVEVEEKEYDYDAVGVRKFDGPVVVDRNVLADGPATGLEFISGEKLVLDNRSAYIERKSPLRPAGSYENR